MLRDRANTLQFEAHLPGLTWTVYVSKDNAAYTLVPGTPVTAVASVTGKSYELTLAASDCDAVLLSFLLIASDGWRYVTGNITTDDLDAVYPGQTLSEIRQAAMDLIDELVNPAIGKFSVAWWNRQINIAKNALANATGYSIHWQSVSVRANQRSVSPPASMCYGVMSLLYLDQELDVTDIFALNQDFPGWRSSPSGTPQWVLANNPFLDLYPAPDRTVVAGTALLSATAGGGFTNQPNNGKVTVYASAPDTRTVTIYGTTFQSGEVISEVITLNGTTHVDSVKTDWGDILGAVASAAASPLITITSPNGTVTTIANPNTSAGVATPTDTDGGRAHPVVTGSGASTAMVGAIGTDVSGQAMTSNATPLSGDPAIPSDLPLGMDTVTGLLLGAVPSTQSVTVNRGGVLQILGGMVPVDLAQDTDRPVDLPVAYHNLLSIGAAAIAEGADLYDAAQTARTGIYGPQFASGVTQLAAYLDSANRARGDMLTIDQSLYSGHFNR